MRCGREFKFENTLVVVMMCASMGIGMSITKTPDPKVASGSFTITSEDTPAKEEAIPQTVAFDYSMVDLSLAVREQVDFLLTPAMLVQEAASDNIVLTYPEE